MDITFHAPERGATVSLYTDAQRVFRSEEERRANLDGALTFTWYALENTGRERSCPAPVRFSFTDNSEDARDEGYLLLVSREADMRDPVFAIAVGGKAEIYNLMAGETYYFCVQKDGVRSAVSYFHTAPDLPRCVRIDGISNARDLGGYEVTGGRIRQGLLYRGSEFERHCHPTEEGMRDIRALGLRTDLDLRGEAKDTVLYPTSRLLGMEYILLPTVPYAALFDKKHRKSTRRFFTLLTHRRAYPIYFHCWGGADRTGSLAFLLGAFLGMKREDLIYEYEFTSLSCWGTRSRNYPPFMEFITALEAFPGDTYAEKADFFLGDVLGLSEKQRTTIKDIFIERNEKADYEA